MNKLLSLLLLALATPLSFAAGEHAGGHGHNMTGMAHGAPSAASAAGRPGDSGRVNRTIAVTMDDAMRFTPSQIEVKAGETIRFFIRNAGKVPHEMVIGTMDELKAHAEMMRKMPDMKHAEPNMITLEPGQRGGIVWQFDKLGTVDFACLVPGHLEAGMAGKVRVE